MVNELVELATDRRSEEPVVRVALREVAEQVAERARRRTDRVITVTADGSEVEGRRAGLDRALGNLVENAAKFAGGGPAAAAPIEITVAAGRVQVDDRGPGIPEADLGHIFDRFYRTAEARSQPGSGLGLSIVHDVVIGHGGSVFAANRPGGGASIGFVLPLAPPG
jgi:two-component system sensor histidine kinase MprB